MHQKQNLSKLILRLIVVSFVLIGCTTKKYSKDVKVDSFFSTSEDYLPNFLDTSYTLIYRIGSIEWSPYITVLALKSNKEASKTTTAFLWQFNFSIEGKTPFIYENKYMNSYRINLENDNVKIVENFNLDINDSILNNYAFDGEGRCNNIYVVRKLGKSNCLIIDKNSNEQTKKVIKDVFGRISAQEHFQSFSLDKNCEQFDSLAYLLLKTGTIDSKSIYQIDHNEIKPISKQNL